jgi:hypothetical protein
MYPTWPEGERYPAFWKKVGGGCLLVIVWLFVTVCVAGVEGVIAWLASCLGFS